MPAGIRSFRYEVDIDCSGYAGDLRDSPVFESVWFSFQRQGRVPAWSAWVRR